MYDYGATQFSPKWARWTCNGRGCPYISLQSCYLNKDEGDIVLSVRTSESLDRITSELIVHVTFRVTLTSGMPSLQTPFHSKGMKIVVSPTVED